MHQAYIFEVAIAVIIYSSLSHIHSFELQPIERASSTNLIFPKTYFDEEESLEDKIQANERIKAVKREKLTQLKRELSICESELKESRNKLRKIKEECEKGSNESHSAQLNHYKPYQQLKQLEMMTLSLHILTS